MMASVFSKNLYDMRRALIWWSVSLFLMNLWIVSLFPAIQESAEALQQYVDNLPAGFQVLVGEAVSFATIEGFLGIELFAFFWPALTLAFAIAYGAGAIGGEEESGTLDLLLSQPIRRGTVLAQKFAAVLVFSASAILAGVLGLFLGTVLIEAELDPANLGAAVFDLWLLTMLFGTFVLALTGVGLRRGAAAGVGAGLAALTFLLNTMVPLAELPEALRRISPWYYYDGGASLHAGLELGSSALLAGLVAALLAVAWFGFERRDLAV